MDEILYKCSEFSFIILKGSAAWKFACLVNMVCV